MSITESGTFNTSDVRPWNQPQLKNDKVFSFTPRPAGFPIGLTALDIDKSANIRVKTYTDTVTQDSVKVHIDSWGDSVLYSAGCTWLHTYAGDRDIQSGSFSTMDDHPWDQPQVATSRKITFPKAFNGRPPKVIVWLNELDMANGANWRCKAYTTDIKNDSFVIHIDTWGDTTLYSATASWIAYPSNRPNIASGSFNTMDVRAWNQPVATTTGNAKFDKRFESIPRVLAGLNWLDVGNTANLRVNLATSNVSVEGLTWNLDSWGDTTLFSAGASYIAILDF